MKHQIKVNFTQKNVALAPMLADFSLSNDFKSNIYLQISWNSNFEALYKI